jgi:DNA-binding transcriptional MerR regulator
MAEFTIDELARKADTTVRNVRAYQDKGLIPPPTRRGRTGIYSEVHLARLRLIGRLLSRGYTLANISELLSAWEQGHDLAHLIGFEEAVTSSWTNEIPSYISMLELANLFGEIPEPHVFDLATKLGILEPEGERLRVMSPRLLHAGAELVRAGVPLYVLLLQLNELRADLRRVGNRFVQLALDHVFEPYRDGVLPAPSEMPKLTELVRRLRPLAQTVVEVEFARSMERIVATTLEEKMTLIASGIKKKPSPKKKK